MRSPNRTRTRSVLLAATSALAATALTATALSALGGCSAGTSGKSASRGAPQHVGGPPTRWSYPTRNPDRSGFANEVDPREQPQSTFAMDVDTASYGYAGNLLRKGQRPAPDDVRPEEFVNAFRQDYPEPPGDGFAVSLDGTRLPDTHRIDGAKANDVRLLRVGLSTRPENPAERPDAALTFVVDVSGSMADPGKLDMVQQAMHTLVEALRPTDSVAIVTFSEHVRVLRPMTRVTQRSDLHAAIDRLETEATTNLEAGLVKGYQVAREGFRSGATNRVVLLSDGLANVGDTQAAPILSRVREEAAKQVTLLGVGVGTDYGDQLMEQLADKGDGFVVYVSGLEQARKAFVEQLPATMPIRALDAKVQVTFDPRTVAGYRLIGYDDRRLAASSFRNDRVDGGEVFAGHNVTALYAVRLREGTGGHVAQVQIRWQDPKNREAHEAGGTVDVSRLSRPFAEAPARLRVDYAAAYLAETLRRSPYGTGVDLGDLGRIAYTAAEDTGDPAVAELADLIHRADR